MTPRMCPLHPLPLPRCEQGVWEAIKQQVAEKGAAQFYGALLRWESLCMCMYCVWLP